MVGFEVVGEVVVGPDVGMRVLGADVGILGEDVGVGWVGARVTKSRNHIVRLSNGSSQTNRCTQPRLSSLSPAALHPGAGLEPAGI